MEAWRERLKARMEELGITPKDLTRRAGVNTSMVHNIFKDGTTPSVENLYKIAQVLGLSLSQLYEGTERVQFTIRINGITTGGGMWAELPPKHARVVPLQFLKDDTVSVEISDDSQTPRFDRGDVLMGTRFDAPHLDNVIGRDCIVQLIDGQRMLGILLRGSTPNTFTIRSINPRQSDVHDVVIQWAAPIRMILRGNS